VDRVTRNPQGKFIGPGEMLYAWLPKMLDWACCYSPLEEMLKIAARWCSLKIASECENPARYLREHDEPELWLRPIARVSLWGQRHKILMETITRLQEVK
jgi:hypothetical protein